MRFFEMIEPDDKALLKIEWDVLHTSDPNGTLYMDAPSPQSRNPQRLARVAGMPNSERFSSQPDNKRDVQAMVRDRKNSSLKLFFYIMAWGGMVNRARNPQMLYRKLQSDKQARVAFIRVLDTIRFGNVSNAQAFDLIQGLRDTGYLPGLGVSFFTKVLYFLRPGKDAFILDQFTAKAINYLNSKDPQNYPRLAMTGDMPASGLTGRDYEAYNQAIKQVAIDLKEELGDMTPEEAEFTIFGAFGNAFRPQVDKWFGSQQGQSQPRQPRTQRQAQPVQQQQPTNQLAQYASQAQSLWNKHIQSGTVVAQTFRKLQGDEKQDFMQEFVDDVAEALKNGTDPNQAIKTVVSNYS